MAKSRASDARSCQEEQKRSNKRDTTDVPGKHQGAAEARGQGAGSARGQALPGAEKPAKASAIEEGRPTGKTADPKRQSLAGKGGVGN